jgi:putative ABC transport system permease protein
MLRNFLIIAFRNLRKNSLYSSINITGLATGIACSVLILLWVVDEVSYDKFLPKYDRLHQVHIKADFDGKMNVWNSVPLPTYKAIRERSSYITNSVVTGWGGDRLLTVDEKRLIRRGYYVSEEFLEMFEYPAISGDVTTALDEPSNIVITQELANALFGDEDPMGQVIRVEDEGSLKVAAVLVDVPGNSSFEFDYLLPWKYREQVSEWVVEQKTNWGNFSFQVFVELNDSKNQAAVDASIAELVMDNADDDHDIANSLFLYPMNRWRLYSNWDDQGNETGGRSDYVQLFTVIAILILIIACINFMNLATARSEKRAKEVGIRKSLGSKRPELILQFIGESVFITFVSFLIAILFTELALPFYNDLVDKKLLINYDSISFWWISIATILVVGTISGSYPAFFLSAFDPVMTLKGTVKTGKGGSLPRKVLVVLQFGFSIILLISTVVIFQQIDLVKKRDIGYDQEYLISVERTEDLTENFEVLKRDLISSGLVSSVTYSNSQITNINSNNFLSWPGKPEDQRVLFVTLVVNYDYAKTMGIEVLEGRDFSKEFATDSSAILINQTALELMNLENPIGQNMELWGEDRRLIGVLDDVLMGSPYDPVRPAFFILDDWGGYVSVRLEKTNDLQGTLASVEEIFNKYNPAYPFDYHFADVDFERKFTTITLTRKLATLFAGLAFLITGLGLFGLASFTAQQRIKEIGIRKVLGASVVQLIGLMSREFTILVLLAFTIATPVAWFGLNQYLDRYPIRVDIVWWIFPIVGILVLGFALLIVSNQANRAARSNPVKALRSE